MSKYAEKRKCEQDAGFVDEVHDVLRRKYRRAFPYGVAFYGFHHLYAYGPIGPELDPRNETTSD